MTSASLTIVGTGLKFGTQLTPQANEVIRRCDRLFYLVYDPVSARWLDELKPSAVSLHRFYRPKKHWRDCCDKMVEAILGDLRIDLNVCAAFGGHPALCVYPSHEAMRRARQEGFATTMLPAISTADCLFADLGVDPGRDGCRMFDVTEFLARRPSLDPQTGLILFQVGTLRRRGALRSLKEMLCEKYPATHPVVIYEAALVTTWQPFIRRVALSSLQPSALTWVSTLYLPPTKRPPVDREMAERLGLIRSTRSDTDLRQ